VKRIAAIFPGQGSQSVGMGVEVATADPTAGELFVRAARVLGYDLLALLREGPEDELRKTQYSQSAIFVTNVALFEACKPAVVVTAGHSFAEFCSLTIAGAISFDDALHVVDERARSMQDAAERAAGGMSAILGLDADRVRPIVDRVRTQTRKRIQLANFNSPTQIVISGDLDAVCAAGDALLEAGAKRVVPLNVSGAWHSELMAPAVGRFAAAVEAARFSVPRFDVISNVDGKPYRDVPQIKTNLIRSITDEVRWHDAVLRMLTYDLDLIVEFGAGAVLTPMLRRMERAPRTHLVSDMAGANALEHLLTDEVRA
jgi:[acyl-carrier-protein] S-malonyltransferase